MDEQAIDRRGIEPIEPELDRIAALQDKNELADVVARLHGIGADVLFSFSSGQDFKNSRDVIAQADQGGLGLPERDYYLKNDVKSVEIRERYLKHVADMFALLGEPPEKNRDESSGRIEHRDRACGRIARRRIAARAGKGLSQNAPAGDNGPELFVRLVEIPFRDKCTSHRDAKCCSAGLFRAPRFAHQEYEPGRLESVPDMAPGSLAGRALAYAVRQ